MFIIYLNWCFATVTVFTKESQGTEFFVLLNYYVNSVQLLKYVYIGICQRRRLHRMSAFKKKEKTPCRMRGIPSNIHQVIKPMDYN